MEKHSASLIVFMELQKQELIRSCKAIFYPPVFLSLRPNLDIWPLAKRMPNPINYLID